MSNLQMQKKKKVVPISGDTPEALPEGGTPEESPKGEAKQKPIDPRTMFDEEREEKVAVLINEALAVYGCTLEALPYIDQDGRVKANIAPHAIRGWRKGKR